MTCVYRIISQKPDRLVPPDDHIGGILLHIKEEAAVFRMFFCFCGILGVSF